MGIYHNISLFFINNLLFTYILWLFMRLKEIDIGLIKFYLFMGIICITLSFFMLRDYFLLYAVIIHILFLLLHSSIQTSNTSISVFCLLNTGLFYMVFRNVILELNLVQTLSLLLLSINSALAFKNLILGHWYLVTPNMSIKHFKNLNIVFSVVSILRFVLLLTAYILLTKNFSLEFLRYNFFDAMFIGKLILLQVSTFIISLMSLNALFYKSTQAATGLFYVIVVFAISDFIVSIYLLNNKFYVF